MMEKLFVREIRRFPILFSLADPAEHAVVRADEQLPSTFNQYSAPVGTDAGIDDRHVNGPGRKAFVTGKEIEGGRVNVARWDLVTDVDNRDLRIDRKDCSLHRADKIVLSAEVGEESDYGLSITDCQFSILRVSVLL
jgi:hypothetical protein